MVHKGYCLASGLLFALVALAHLLRIVYGLSIRVEGVVVPMFVSWIALVVPAALAIWAFALLLRAFQKKAGRVGTLPE